MCRGGSGQGDPGAEGSLEGRALQEYLEDGCKKRVGTALLAEEPACAKAGRLGWKGQVGKLLVIVSQEHQLREDCTAGRRRSVQPGEASASCRGVWRSTSSKQLGATAGMTGLDVGMRMPEVNDVQSRWQGTGDGRRLEPKL